MLALTASILSTATDCVIPFNENDMFVTSHYYLLAANTANNFFIIYSGNQGYIISPRLVVAKNAYASEPIAYAGASNCFINIDTIQNEPPLTSTPN